MKGYEYKGHTKLNSTHFSDLVGPFVEFSKKYKLVYVVLFGWGAYIMHCGCSCNPGLQIIPSVEPK